MPKRQKMKKARKSVSNNLAGRVSKLENMLNKTLENKISDFRPTGFAPVNVTSLGLTYLAFARNFLSGPDSDERVGNKVTLMSLTFRGELRAPASGNEQHNQIRLIICENIGFTGATDLALSDVLEYSDFSTYGTQVFVSPYKTKVEATKRYRIIMDNIITLNQTTKGYYHFKKKVSYGTKNNRGKVLTFESPTDPFPNNHRLVMFAISDSTSAGHPDLTLNVRNVYKDA
jgi:hypothetical protein